MNEKQGKRILNSSVDLHLYTTSDFLTCKLSGCVVGFPVTYNTHKESPDWKVLQAPKGLTSWTFT